MAGTGELLLEPHPSFPLVPGLATQITVPQDAFVYVTTSGGVEMAADGESLVRILLFVGDLPVNGGIAELMANGTGGYTLVRWNLSTIVKLPAGTHKIEVRTRSRNGSKPAYVSGDQGETAGRQGTLTALILKR